MKQHPLWLWLVEIVDILRLGSRWSISCVLWLRYMAKCVTYVLYVWWFQVYYVFHMHNICVYHAYLCVEYTPVHLYYMCIIYTCIICVGYTPVLYVQDTHLYYMCRIHTCITGVGYTPVLQVQDTHLYYKCRIHTCITYISTHVIQYIYPVQMYCYM